MGASFILRGGCRPAPYDTSFAGTSQRTDQGCRRTFDAVRCPATAHRTNATSIWLPSTRPIRCGLAPSIACSRSVVRARRLLMPVWLAALPVGSKVRSSPGQPLGRHLLGVRLSFGSIASSGSPPRPPQNDVPKQRANRCVTQVVDGEYPSEEGVPPRSNGQPEWPRNCRRCRNPTNNRLAIYPNKLPTPSCGAETMTVHVGDADRLTRSVCVTYSAGGG
jgi:hypothetical protein